MPGPIVIRRFPATTHLASDGLNLTIPRMPQPAAPPEPPVTPDADDPDIAGDMATLQVLMAEHASLVSARSLAYNEAFTRAGMFLQALGMSFLGMSLLGAALGFSRDVLVIAMVVVAFDVLIGIATFRRVADTGREDLWAMQAMNRIRHGYVRVAPGSRPFITAGTFDDVPSVMRSYGFTEPSTSTAVGDLVYGISTSLGLVGMVLVGRLRGPRLARRPGRRRLVAGCGDRRHRDHHRRVRGARRAGPWAPRARTRRQSRSGSRRRARTPAVTARTAPPEVEPAGIAVCWATGVAPDRTRGDCMTVPVIILIVIVVVIALFLVSLYNGLVTKRNQIDEALGQIEVQLKRRHDLIPNLINAVKGYMGFEQKVLTEVTEARANAVAAGAKGPAEQANAENALTSSLRSLFAVVENYPELKANENVLRSRRS